MKKLPGLDWFLLASPWCAIVPPPTGSAQRYLLPFLSIRGVAAAAAIGSVWITNRNGYFLVLALHVTTSLILVPLVAGMWGVEFCLFSMVLLGICLHNPFPLNIILAMAFNLT